MTRRTNLTTSDSLEQLAHDGRYDIEFGRDSRGEYGALVTREGVEYRAYLTAVAS